MHPVTAAVTARIIERSRETRTDYLARMAEAGSSAPGRAKLSCANWAHAFAASPDGDKQRLRNPTAPNIAIVSSYNDMLSAHQPFERFPEIIKAAAEGAGEQPSSPAGFRPCATGSPRAAGDGALAVFPRRHRHVDSRRPDP